jgi:hypothetical protein
LLLSIVLYKYKDQGSFRLTDTVTDIIPYIFPHYYFLYMCVCAYVLFYPKQRKGKKRHLAIVLNMRRRTRRRRRRRREEKNHHHKFGGRSLSVYILRYLFCIAAVTRVYTAKKNVYGRKKRKMASPSFIVDRWSSRVGEKYN